jgi:hypothetical protein
MGTMLGTFPSGNCSHSWANRFVYLIIAITFAFYFFNTNNKTLFLLNMIWYEKRTNKRIRIYKNMLHIKLSHHHHLSFMEMGHLLTRSGLTCPEASSKVCHDSFCRSGRSVSLSWVVYYEAFCLHVVSSFSCILVICPKLELFLTPLKFVIFFFFVICPSLSCCSPHVFHLCCCYSASVPCIKLNNMYMSWPLCGHP